MLSDTVLVAFIAIIPSSIAAIIGYLTHEKVIQVQKQTDGLAHELARVTGEKEKAIGIEIGIEKGIEKEKAKNGSKE